MRSTMDQFQDMLDRNVVSPLTIKEIQSYKGPVNYIMHHKVYKESNSTLVRLMSNSSFNNCLVKGPNTLADIYENLIKL